jgi:hypothetical protein
MSVLTDGADLLKSALRRIFSSPFVPAMVAVVLFAAALLKGYEAASIELDEHTILRTRWFVVALVMFELALGLWLLAGLHEPWSRLFALFTFVVFSEGALYLLVIGVKTCGCLGRLSPPPWLALMLDLVMIALLFVWRPMLGATVASHPWRLLCVVVVFVLSAIPVVVSMVSYAPRAPMVRLRSDPQLGVRVPIQLKHASVEQVLMRVHSATGLDFSIEETLATSLKEKPPDLGEITTQNARAWAVLELVAQKQPVPTRWTRVNGGYLLLRGAPFGTLLPWILSSVVLLAATIGALLVRSRHTQGSLEPRN